MFNNTTIEKLKLENYLVLILLSMTIFLLISCVHIKSNISPGYNEIPIIFHKGLPSVKISIKGKKYYLVVDTGSNLVNITLKTKVLEELKFIDNSKTKEIRYDTLGNEHRGKKFVIPEVRIGSMKIKNLIGSEETRNYAELDGVIGNRFLSQYYVLFDYSIPAIYLFHEEKEFKTKKENWKAVPFILDSKGIILEFAFSHQSNKINLCFDTGCAIIDNGKNYGVLHSKYLKRNNNFETVFFSQQQNAPFFSVTDRLFIGNMDLGIHDFILLDFKKPIVDGFWSNNILQSYKVFFDFNKQLMYLNKI